MRLTNSPIKDIAVLPISCKTDDLACCLAFYDYSHSYDINWMQFVENVFAEFEVFPSHAIGRLGGKKACGKYNRVKKRLCSFLKDSEESIEPDFEFNSEPIYPEDDFFPSDLQVAWSTGIVGQRKGIVSVRQNRVAGVQELVDRIGNMLFDVIGPAYVTAFNFPAVFGPNCYLASLGSVPAGYRSSEYREYTKRITQWRDNVWHEGLRTSQGYFREIYPINFLLKTHLERDFQGQPLSSFMRERGKLEVSNLCNGVYRWDVRDVNLDAVRNELEESGLILSAPIAARL